MTKKERLAEITKFSNIGKPFLFGTPAGTVKVKFEYWGFNFYKLSKTGKSYQWFHSMKLAEFKRWLENPEITVK